MTTLNTVNGDCPKCGGPMFVSIIVGSGIIRFACESCEIIIDKATEPGTHLHVDAVII